MKVKTITCHNVYNYGASLQEYALLQYLKKQGHDVETINYRPPYLSYHYNLFSVENSKFKKNIFTKVLYILLKAPTKLWRFPRKLSFDKFSKTYIKTTPISFKSNQELKKHPPEADVYIVGSDQVWNTSFQNGYDPSFYLDFVPTNKKRISYAASFAVNHLLEKDKEFVRKYIKQLDAISVRENSGQAILQDLEVKISTHVLDPVFLLDKSEWEKMTTNKMLDNYLLVYDFDNNPMIKKIAIKIKMKRKLKIVALNSNIKYADKNYYQKGPLEFLSLIRYADMVLANSFHALAFSIIFEKKILIFGRNQKINTRMIDLLSNLNLINRYISGDYDIAQEMFVPVDYVSVNKKLIPLIDQSKTFLQNQLAIIDVEK